MAKKTIDHRQPMNCGRKAHHKLTIFTGETDDQGNEEKLTIKLAKPLRPNIEIALSFMTSDPPQMIKAGEAVLLSSWVDGDERIWKEDNLYMSACTGACGLIELKRTELEKL
jgi:hypothetical protein